MERRQWMRVTALVLAGFGAGVVMVVACEGGPDAAGAQAECATCTLAGPVELASPVQIAGPLVVQVPRCKQWELRVDRLVQLENVVVSNVGSNYVATATAPESWEPVSGADGIAGDGFLFRRCARWE